MHAVRHAVLALVALPVVSPRPAWGLIGPPAPPFVAAATADAVVIGTVSHVEPDPVTITFPPTRKGQEERKWSYRVAVVDIADRCRRAQQRQYAVADQGSQHEHVVALVAVPCPARGQVGEPEQCRKDQEPRQREPVDGRGAPIDHAGAIRPRALPASSKAARGNRRNGSPAQRARARSMFTLS